MPSTVPAQTRHLGSPGSLCPDLFLLHSVFVSSLNFSSSSWQMSLEFLPSPASTTALTQALLRDPSVFWELASQNLLDPIAYLYHEVQVFKSSQAGHVPSRLSLFPWDSSVSTSPLLLVLCVCARGSSAWNGLTALSLVPFLFGHLQMMSGCGFCCLSSGLGSCTLPSVFLWPPTLNISNTSIPMSSEHTSKCPWTLVESLSFLQEKACNQAL